MDMDTNNDNAGSSTAYTYETNNGELDEHNNPASTFHHARSDVGGDSSGRRSGVVHTHSNNPDAPNALSNPMTRRGSMSNLEQSECCASIRNIMKDTRLSAFEKRKTIQTLMDGRRASIDCVEINPYLQYKANQA